MKNFVLILSIALLLAISSCYKAGLEGENTLVLEPKHHGLNINGAVAYIKFNSSELPDTVASAFDLVVRAGSADSNIFARNLKRGRYYVYCVGFDPSINQQVRGGVPVVINTRMETINKVVPVTEAH